ncbi:MAG: DegV family protein [Clostridia bacterium]|nr:DegV family protein [Clostridia bacterium]
MGRVKIVTNACCDLTPEVAALHNIEMIPEAMIFGADSYLSNIDMTPEMLYKKIREYGDMPTGSHPNTAMYMDAFRSAAEYDQVLCLNMTSKLTGAINSAFLAKATLEEEGFAPEIFVYDTLTLSHGLGYLVMEAALLAEAGKSAEEIIAHMDALRDRIGVYFVMESLKYAKKAGRLGAIRTVAADALGVKPVLQLHEGTVKERGLVRKFKLAIKRLAEIYGEKAAERGGKVMIFHADNLEAAEYLKSLILEIDPAAEVSIGWLGGGIGIYTGPGTTGLAFIE